MCVGAELTKLAKQLSSKRLQMVRQLRIALLMKALLALQMAWQVAGLKQDQPEDCLMRFKSNRYLGWIFLFGVFAAGFRAL